MQNKIKNKIKVLRRLQMARNVLNDKQRIKFHTSETRRVYTSENSTIQIRLKLLWIFHDIFGIHCVKYAQENFI